MIIGFLSGLFIGAVAGVAVMSLCAAAKERVRNDKERTEREEKGISE